MAIFMSTTKEVKGVKIVVAPKPVMAATSAATKAIPKNKICDMIILPPARRADGQ